MQSRIKWEGNKEEAYLMKEGKALAFMKGDEVFLISSKGVHLKQELPKIVNPSHKPVRTYIRSLVVEIYSLPKNAKLKTRLGW